MDQVLEPSVSETRTPHQLKTVAIIGSRGYPSSYGGFETFVRRFAPYLRDQGVDVTVYHRAVSRAESGKEDTYEGVRRVFTRGVNSRSASTLTHGLSAGLDARKKGFDAALVLNVANGFFLPVLRHAGIPTAVNVDGIEWARAKWGRAAKAMFRSGAGLTARYADMLIADSEAIGDIWKNKFNRDSAFIPYGADIIAKSAEGADLLKEREILPGSYVLVVARLVPENNVDLLLDAMGKIGHKIPLVVVGSSVGASPIEERLRIASEHHSNVHWLGHVSDQNFLQQLWAHSLLYVHGHSVGGTNPALLQALGCGAPTIALDTVFNREVLGGATANLYSEDAEALSKLIIKLAADAAARVKMVEDGRRIIESRYTWEGVCSRYLKVLDSIKV